MQEPPARVCPHCDYPLGTRPDAGVCPNCGTFYAVDSVEDDGPPATMGETLEYLIWPGVLLGTSSLAVVWTQFAWEKWRGFALTLGAVSAVLFFIAAATVFLGCIRTGAAKRDARIWTVLGVLAITARALAVLMFVLLAIAGVLSTIAKMLFPSSF